VEPNDDSSRPNPVPAWAYTVERGTLDRRLLDQDRIWITGDSRVLALTEMPNDHLRNVQSMLETHARLLHFHAVLDALEAAVVGDLIGCPSGDRLAFELVGRGVADCEPLAWLRTTALVRAIGRELRGREAE